jgi:TRAP-type C4-dicarboxylate transport system substrate-binding protein
MNWIARFGLVVFVLLPFAAAAEPINLKLSYFSSDRSTSYRASVKPFLDAVNAQAQGVIHIEPFTGGSLGKDLSQQPDLVLNGTTDIAYVIAGMTRNRFPDNNIIEMPGLYRDMREATFVFTRLMAAGALKGYEDFFVIGAFVTEPETVHSRTPIATLDDLKGKKIRVNNPGEAAGLDKLGAIPVLMPVNQISEALTGGRLDAALVPPSPLTDFGIKRVATYHYMLGTSGAPLLLVMNRKKFESLPEPAQNLIRKYSGQWAAERFIETYDVAERQIMQQLKSDPDRKVIMPTARELDTAHAAFKSVKDEWAAVSPRNRELLKAAELEIAKLRAGQ